MSSEALQTEVVVESLAERVAKLQTTLDTTSEGNDSAFRLNALGVEQNTQSVIDFNDWVEWSSHW